MGCCAGKRNTGRNSHLFKSVDGCAFVCDGSLFQLFSAFGRFCASGLQRGFAVCFLQVLFIVFFKKTVVLGLVFRCAGRRRVYVFHSNRFDEQ